MKAKAKVGCKETSLIPAHSRKHKHTFARMHAKPEICDVVRWFVLVQYVRNIGELI